MVFSILSRLKWKGAASATTSEHSPLPSCDLNCLAKGSDMRDSLFRSSDKGFGNIFIIGYGMYLSGMIILMAIDDGSNVDEYFLMQWSNVNRFLRGIWTRQVDWGNLPPEMWGEIGKRMVSRLDIVSFRSVCKRWRSSLPSPTGRFPLLLPPPPTCDPEFREIPYAITELTFYRKVLGWPSMQVDEGGIFALTFDLSLEGDKVDYEQASIWASPVRLRTFKSLWKEKAKHDRQQLMNDLSLFAKVYYPCKALDSHELRERGCNKFPKKLVLISSSNAHGVDPNYASMSDLSVVAHLGWEGKMKGRLALLRLGGSPENWVWDTDFCTQVFVNIATYKGQLCTLDQLGRVFVMDYNSLKLTLLCAPTSVPPELGHKGLFEAYGDLYLVDFKLWSEATAEAYKLSLCPQMWLQVDYMSKHSMSSIAPFLL